MQEPIEIKFKTKKSRPVKLWLEIANDFNNGELSADEIAQKYKHKNGKSYTRSHVYYIIKELEKMGLVKIVRK